MKSLRNTSRNKLTPYRMDTTMMNLLITIPDGELRRSFISEDTISLLKKHFNVYLNDTGKGYTDENIYAAARDMDVLVTGWGTPSLSANGLTSKGCRLKLLVHTGGSVGDLIDGGAYENGVTVISGNSIYAESTAEGALAYILAALRHIPDEVNSMKNGDYWDSPNLTKGLFERTVGIIGVGSVSRNLMRFMKPFRVKLKVWDTYKVDEDFLCEVGAGQVSFEEVLSSCSVVSVHAALGKATRGLIGARELALIPDGALLVNTSRGPIIDEEALARELSGGRFSAVLDVFTREPLPHDSPLRQMKNVCLIPHKAGPTYDLRAMIGYKLAEDAVRFIKGEKLSFEIKADAAMRMTKHS